MLIFDTSANIKRLSEKYWLILIFSKMQVWSSRKTNQISNIRSIPRGDSILIFPLNLLYRMLKTGKYIYQSKGNISVTTISQSFLQNPHKRSKK